MDAAASVSAHLDADAATGMDERMAKTGKSNSQAPREGSSAGNDAAFSSADPRDGAGSAGGESNSRTALESTLRMAAAGDQRAWRVLVETYSSRVFGLIRAQCGSTDLAEEITQSAFCTVVAKIGDYTEVGKFEQWLFRIAMNRLRDEMRRRKRQARPVEDEALHAFADTGGSVGAGISGGGGAGNPTRNAAGASDDFFMTGLADSEQLKALRAALADLPDADQQIIHLRHSAGLSFKEIAEVLEQPLGTVLARQHRALKKLAEVLRPVMGRGSTVGPARKASGDGGGSEKPDGRLGGLNAQPSGP